MPSNNSIRTYSERSGLSIHFEKRNTVCCSCSSVHFAPSRFLQTFNCCITSLKRKLVVCDRSVICRIQKQLVDTHGNGHSHLTSSSRMFSSTSARTGNSWRWDQDQLYLFCVALCWTLTSGSWPLAARAPPSSARGQMTSAVKWATITQCGCCGSSQLQR